MDHSIRHCAVLIVDIAGSVRLRDRIGDAAAERQIRHLLDAVMDTAREHGGNCIKSYGDDVMVIYENSDVNAAAATAIAAQLLAMRSGMEMYAGFHVGPVEFRTTMGHPDAVGMTVSLAARLHKLTEGAPGRIFMTEEWISALSPELKNRAHLFGPRDLKGLGNVNIWTIDWQDSSASTATYMAPSQLITRSFTPILLRHAGNEVNVGDSKTFLIGRGKECALRIFDPESRISTTHLQLEYNAGCWFAQDISRNGTWMRDLKTGEIQLLPYCNKAMLPKRGDLCLGRSHADDAAGQFTISFQPADE